MDIIPTYFSDEAKQLNLAYVEDCVLQFLKAFTAASFGDHTTSWPVIVRVGLLGTNGVPFESGIGYGRQHSYGLPPRQPSPVLVLPDVLLEDKDGNLEDLMHGAFVRMWHAWGFARSLSYVKEGEKWVRPNR